MDTTDSSDIAEQAYDDELDLSVLLDFVKAHWRVLLALVVIGGGTGLGMSFLFKRVYRADAVLIAADDFGMTQQGGGIGSMGGLGGVASLVGISLPRDHQTEEALATLQSRALIERYIEDQNLLPILFKDKWDTERRTWRSSHQSKVPTLYDGYFLFKKKLLGVSQDKKTGLIMVSLEWRDPVLAQQWLQGLVARTNALLRTKAIDRSNRDLAYLNEQVDKTAVVELRSALYSLIEVEIKKVMIAQGSDDYAFRYVDPPVVPERPVSPKRIIFLLGGAFLALVLGSAWIYFTSLSKHDEMAV